MLKHITSKLYNNRYIRVLLNILKIVLIYGSASLIMALFTFLICILTTLIYGGAAVTFISILYGFLIYISFGYVLTRLYVYCSYKFDNKKS